MKKILSKCSLALALLTIPFGAEAQTTPSESKLPTIVVPHKHNINYLERTLTVDVVANVDFQVSDDASWVETMIDENGKLLVFAQTNQSFEQRAANIIFTNEEHGLQETFVLVQNANESVNTLPTDIKIKPSSGSVNSAQGSSGWANTVDDDISTMWHTAWSGFNVSESNPAIIEFHFTDVDKIDYLNYIPRSGGGNGSFGLVDVYTKCLGDTDYVLHSSHDWKQSASIRSIEFANGLINPKSIKFVIKSGAGNFASCAEMQFFVINPEKETIFNVFADDVYSQLKEGITQADIDAIDNDFAKSLAQQIFDGKYSTDYRVANYEPYLHYDVLSKQWCTAGKRYSQYEGVTGINISKGKHAIVVSGIPNGESVELKVTAWYVGKLGHNFDGGNPETRTYSLKNGLNIIEYNHDWDGLAYVGYYTEKDPATLPDIKVHFIHGEVNGYLSLDKTNDEMYDICANAKNTCMDIMGNKVQQVWSAQGLRDYCKDINGNPKGYRQYIAVIDSLIQWEHDEIGFTKYNRIPKNHTLAYVNYTYYMFQGGLGVSFHVGQESRVLNCKNIMKSDHDAIWGLSHEWGHQHQMHPYLCWSGLGEVSNNIFSYYNIMHMGYNDSDKIHDWPRARKAYYEDSGFSTGKLTSHARSVAYQNVSNDINKFAYSPKMRALCLAMEDSIIKPYATDPLHAVALHDDAEGLSVGTTLNSFIMLGNYAKLKLQKPGAAEGKKYLDFYPDLFETFRRMQNEGGSDIEKQDGWDKYELIFHAQYGTLNNAYAILKQKYPQSAWIKDNYVTSESHKYGNTENVVPAILNFIRKASRLYGYNLFPYFERHGYLRTIALSINDYSWGYYVLTPEMYNEFKADMDALVADGTLKEMPDGMVRDMMYCPDLNDKVSGITRYPTPNVPN